MMRYQPRFRVEDWPQSEALLKRAIALPISVRMGEEQIKKVIAGVNKAAKEVL